jgi:DNA-binding beta-propeller fold protein YncE
MQRLSLSLGWLTRVPLGAALLVTLLTVPLRGQSGCDAPLLKPSITVSVPGKPFQALPSVDGCWVFVSIPDMPDGSSGIAVLSRANGTLAMKSLTKVDASVAGMVLTHDGQTLMASADQRIVFLDVKRLVSTPESAVLGYLDEPGRAPQLGRIYANITSDDSTLFVADERAQTITVVNMAKARATNYAAASIIGQIPTGTAPIALTFSHDGTTLFATSQRAPASLRWPIECKREQGSNTRSVNPQGAIHIIDIQRAKTDPARAVMRSVPAGCNPVRLVLSPSGDRAYVTARGNNALLVFDTARLLNDPEHSLIGRVEVGTAPVGIAVVDDGRRVIVTNSNRFAGGTDDKQFLTVVDATRIGGTDADHSVIGSIPAGAFPREMRVTPDGRTLILTNYSSSTVQAIDVTHLPIVPAQR